MIFCTHALIICEHRYRNLKEKCTQTCDFHKVAIIQGDYTIIQGDYTIIQGHRYNRIPTSGRPVLLKQPPIIEELSISQCLDCSATFDRRTRQRRCTKRAALVGSSSDVPHARLSSPKHLKAQLDYQVRRLDSVTRRDLPSMPAGSWFAQRPTRPQSRACHCDLSRAYTLGVRKSIRCYWKG